MNAIPRRGHGPRLAVVLFALSLAVPVCGQSPGFRPGQIPDDWLEPGVQPGAGKTEAVSAERRARFEELLGDPEVLLLRAHRAWHPALGAQVRDTADGWLAVKANEVLGFFPSSLLPDDESGIRARRHDAAAQHEGTWLTPGLVDADSRWFRSPQDLADSKSDPTTKAATSLMTWQEGWRELLRRGGVTKLWVPASTTGTFAGQGALLDLDPEGGPKLATEESALHVQISGPKTQGTSLTRRSVVEALGKQFEAAQKHREALEKFEKELAEYAKKRKEFLAYYEKNPLKPGERAPAAARSSSGGRPRMPQLTAEQRAELMKLPPPQRMAYLQKLMAEQRKQEEDAAKKGEEKKDDKGGDKAPPRPEYPKKPNDNPVLDTLLRVLDGKLALRVEAHHAAEIEAMLELADEYGLRHWTLYGASEALAVAPALRRAGVPVVLAPMSLDERRFDPLVEQLPQLAARLTEAGVEVSLATGSKEASADLRLLAARAVAWGMPEAAALAAISANALRSTPGGGSEDLVLWDGHPLAPEARPLAIVRSGKLTTAEALHAEAAKDTRTQGEKRDGEKQ